MLCQPAQCKVLGILVAAKASVKHLVGWIDPAKKEAQSMRCWWLESLKHATLMMESGTMLSLSLLRTLIASTNSHVSHPVKNILISITACIRETLQEVGGMTKSFGSISLKNVELLDIISPICWSSSSSKKENLLTTFLERDQSSLRLMFKRGNYSTTRQVK